ncbi:MAG TPA: hypothetical protein DC038_08420 [Clostridiales bacterium]|nr:hypothetical protein [Clostridiales bacterium]
MVPAGIAANKVVAKCTAGPMTYGKDTDAFYHLYKTADGQLWFTNTKISGASEYPGIPKDGERYASFCIKTNGSVTIRWFYTSADLSAALPYCKAIIAAPHPLVYDSKSVFENIVYSTDYGNKRIADWSDLNNSANHYHDKIFGLK